MGMGAGRMAPWNVPLCLGRGRRCVSLQCAFSLAWSLTQRLVRHMLYTDGML
jgi:hypothetical protein